MIIDEVTTFFCPRCQTQATRMQHSGDFVHNCQGTESLRNEDILIIGDWEDFTGSDLNVHPEVLRASRENTLQGTRAGLEGDKNAPQRTSRGFPTSRYRTRQHREYFDAKFFKIQRTPMDREPREFTRDS